LTGWQVQFLKLCVLCQGLQTVDKFLAGESGGKLLLLNSGMKLKARTGYFTRGKKESGFVGHFSF